MCVGDGVTEWTLVNRESISREGTDLQIYFTAGTVFTIMIVLLFFRKS